MDRLPIDLFVQLQLSQQDAARVAKASKAMNRLVTAAWCESGITVGQIHAAGLLRQDDGARWKPLRKLTIWAHWLPADQILGWKPHEGLLPCLQELVLNRAMHPLRPWHQVILTMPALQILEINTRFGSRSATTIKSLQDLVRAAAPQLKKLKLHCEGVVIYPKPFLVEETCVAIRSLWDASCITSETLQIYHNTGKQAACLPVNAPLKELVLEEGDAGPEALVRIGSACNLTLETLKLTGLAERMPGNVRQRFPMIRDFSVKFERIRRIEDVMHWLCEEIPAGTKRLRLEFDFYWFLPDEWVAWERGIFSSLAHLEELEIHCSHAALGTSNIVKCLDEAPHSLRVVTFSTEWCAVESYYGELSCTEGERDEMSEYEIEELRRERWCIRKAAVEIMRNNPALQIFVNLA